MKLLIIVLTFAISGCETIDYEDRGSIETTDIEFNYPPCEKAKEIYKNEPC